MHLDHREMAFVHGCRCWVAPAIHLLLKDPVLCHFLVTKGLYSASNSVQSQLLKLVDQFLQHQKAVDLEPLLDALAEYSPWLSRRRADGKRKAIHEQLEWSEAAEYILHALVTPPDSTDDEVPFQTACLLCAHPPDALVVCSQLGQSCFWLHGDGHPRNPLHKIACRTS